MAPERLWPIWPHLISACHLRVVRIDPFSWIGSPIDVAGAKHDLRKSRQACAYTRRLWANDILNGVACSSGDNLSARIRFHRRREKAQRERRLGRSGEDLESKTG